MLTNVVIMNLILVLPISLYWY